MSARNSRLESKKQLFSAPPFVLQRAASPTDLPGYIKNMKLFGSRIMAGFNCFLTIKAGDSGTIDAKRNQVAYAEANHRKTSAAVCLAP